MKKIFLILTILFSGIQAFNQQKQFKELVGRWEIVGEKNDSACLEIIDSTTIILSYMGEKRKILDYKIDFQRSPIWFDFTTGDSSSSVVVKSLLMKAVVPEVVPEHFRSYKGNANTPYHSKNLSRDGIFLSELYYHLCLCRNEFPL